MRSVTGTGPGTCRCLVFSLPPSPRWAPVSQVCLGHVTCLSPSPSSVSPPHRELLWPWPWPVGARSAVQCSAWASRQHWPFSGSRRSGVCVTGHWASVIKRCRDKPQNHSCRLLGRGHHFRLSSLALCTLGHCTVSRHVQPVHIRAGSPTHPPRWRQRLLCGPGHPSLTEVQTLRVWGRSPKSDSPDPNGPDRRGFGG